MTYDPNAARYIMALTMGDGDFDLVTNALGEAPYHYYGAAGAFDLLAEGFRSGLFDAGDGRAANLCELLGIGMRHLAETHGELLEHHATMLRKSKENAPMEFVKPEPQGAPS
ncbi:hypothetical protein PGB28_05495 [Primorskyibacter aestuariivivens]|uniref:hypothetical protein n=1 Tax=Primorskyibacter aestuariivivens TaxID=1888912 RepID=UPI0023007F1F|nr:hypothetical protein [Primorskyibacter aestuariivivens]MDA7427903.1 hypothetical protein [Primorskyibacter aestuariivivens]